MFDATAMSTVFGPSLDAVLPAIAALDPTVVVEAVLPLAQDQLSHFLAREDLLDVLRIPFGDQFDPGQAVALAEDWITGDFSQFPSLAVVSSEWLLGANAGFDALTGTIYLADDWLTLNVPEPATLVGVLLEEIGHFIDAQINSMDAPGDEGAIFATIVQQQDLTTEALAALKVEDDTASLVLGDRPITIEKSSTLDNTLATANDLGTLSGSQVLNDFVGSTDTNDFYRFTIATASNFSLVLDGMSANANVRLLNASGQQIIASSKTGTTAEVINNTLDIGTYFVQVFPYGSANTNYNLTLTANPLPPDGAGNTLGTALDLGTLSGTQNFYDAVDSSDKNDYYHFSVTSPINFSLVLNGMSANANVRLLNATGQQIVASSKLGSNADVINRILNVGDYFVQVFPYGSTRTAYNLSLTADVLPPDLSGNTLSTARALGSVSGTQTFYDFVGSIDKNDYYQFSVETPMNFSLILDGMSANANVRLLNANGQQIAASSKTGTTAETLTRTLNAGTYFVHVFPYGSANTSYNLSLTTDAGPTDAAGNTLSTARDLGILSDTQTFADFVGALDPNDYYRFELDRSSDFSLILDGMSANADVKLLNASGQPILTSTKTGMTADTMTRTLNIGTYFIQVYPSVGANTSYNLGLTATPVESPPATGSFNIQFDYRFDTRGFFNDPARRSALEAAANLWESILLDEFADVPAGTSLYVRNPETDTMQSITAGTIDDLLVVVGSRSIDGLGNALADGSPSFSYTRGSSLQTRWEGPDFEPWTGSVSFDLSEHWFFDTTPSTSTDIPAGATDFITVAVHELGHVLGFTPANAFNSWISNGTFTGPMARSIYGGPVPMQGSHIAASATGNHLMNPSYTFGTRERPTNLDRAILDDLGYTVSYA